MRLVHSKEIYHNSKYQEVFREICQRSPLNPLCWRFLVVAHRCCYHMRCKVLKRWKEGLDKISTSLLLTAQAVGNSFFNVLDAELVVNHCERSPGLFRLLLVSWLGYYPCIHAFLSL